MNVVAVNVIAVLLDASLLTTEYTNHFDVQTTYKPVVYSIKLLLEFTVLNNLLALIRTTPSSIEDVQQLHRDDVHIGPLQGGNPDPEGSTPCASAGRGSSRESFLKTHECWIWNANSHP